MVGREIFIRILQDNSVGLFGANFEQQKRIIVPLVNKVGVS